MTARGALLAAGWAIFWTLAEAPPAAGQAARDLYQEGAEAYRSGDYAGAQRLLREYVEANGDKKGPAAAHLGEAYHYLGLMTPDAKLAEGYFLAVAQRYPAAPVADESLARLAQLYGARGRYGDARREWNALATNYPLSRYVPAANLRIGQTYYAEGDLQNAYDAFTFGFAKMKTFQRTGGRGADLATIEGEYVFWLGRTLLARKAYGDARKYFNLVLMDYPGHPLEAVALYYLSQADRGDGKTKEADDAWRRFSESVRNASLEPVAQNPDLIAIAAAREAGALRRPPEADARVAERRAAQAKAEAGEQAKGAGAGGPARSDRPGELADAGRAGEPTGGGGRAGVSGLPVGVGQTGDVSRGEAPRTEPSTADAAPERTLRAPEPGRPGGAVESEPTAEDRARAAQVERQGQQLLGQPQGVSQPAGTEAARPESLAVPAASGAELEPIEPGLVYLQMGAFTIASSAAQLSTELRKKKFDPSIDSGLRDGKAFYRVRFGPYEVPREREELEAQRSALLKAGYVPTVARREPGSESRR
jgi:TolA-binding protein/cell division septation protein DedD